MSLFEPIAPHLSLRDRIVQDVLAKIESHELQVGDRLLPERELAVAYQVSRTAVRDALRTLAGLGVLTIRHGQGVFVRGSQGVALGQALWVPLVVQPNTVTLLFEVRKSLEVEAAGWASLRASESQKTELLTLVDLAKTAVQEAAVVDPEVAGQADQAFHTQLFLASGNPIAGRLMLNLLELLEEVRQKSLAIPGRAWLSVCDHERIAHQILAGNATLAREAMADHLASVEADILAAFRSDPSVDALPGEMPVDSIDS